MGILGAEECLHRPVSGVARAYFTEGLATIGVFMIYNDHKAIAQNFWNLVYILQFLLLRLHIPSRCYLCDTQPWENGVGRAV